MLRRESQSLLLLLPLPVFPPSPLKEPLPARCRLPAKMLIGVQLTCAMVGKGHRIAAYTQSEAYLAKKGGMLKSATATGQFQVSDLLPGSGCTSDRAMGGRCRTDECRYYPGSRRASCLFWWLGIPGESFPGKLDLADITSTISHEYPFRPHPVTARNLPPFDDLRSLRFLDVSPVPAASSP